MDMQNFDFNHVKDYKLYTVLVALAPILKPFLYSKLQVFGKENIPKSDKGIILAANHINAKDPGVISVMAGPRHKIHFMGKQELFENKYAFFLLKHFNGFPIRRGEHDAVALQYAQDVVTSGRMLGMFIEGTRSRDGKLQKPKTGVARIARETNASILPVSVYSESGGAFLKPLTIRYGKVIAHADLCYEGDNDFEQLQAVSDQVMASIREMWEKGHDAH